MFLKKNNFSFLLILVISSWILSIIANEILESIYGFSETFCNGTFQILNPLRRIDLGQIMGKDFFFFHGILIPYTIYPLYKYFGSTLFSAEFSRQITVFLLFLVINYFTIHTIVQNHKEKLLSFTCLLISTSPFLYRGEHSLLGLRSLPPLLFAISFFYKSSIWLRIIQGSIFSWCLLNSTEQGLGIALALISLVFILIIMKKIKLLELNSWVHAFVFTLSFIATSASLLRLLKIDVDSLSKIIEFNYQIVPSEQFWYYGAPPVQFVFLWTDFIKLPIIREMLSLIIILLISILLLIYLLKNKTATTKDFNLIQIGLILAIYGISSSVSCLGIASEVYLLVAERSMLILSLIFLNISFSRNKILDFYKTYIQTSIQKIISKTDVKKIADLAQKIILYTSLTVILLSIFKICYLTQGKPYLNNQNNSRKRMNWAQWYNKISKINFDKSLWSIYASLAEYKLGILNPHTDYIIHALGNKQRDEYLATLKTVNPIFIQTFDKDYTPWEEWLEGNSWNIWDHILDNYSVYKQIRHSIFWKRNKFNELKRSEWTAIQTKHPKRFIIKHTEQSKYGLYILKFKYKIINKYHIPFTDKLTRFLVSIFNANNRYSISLSPYRTEVKIPIYLTQKQNRSKKEIEIQIADIGLFSNLIDIEIKDIQYQWVSMPFKTYKAMTLFKKGKRKQYKKLLSGKKYYKKKISRKNLQFYDFEAQIIDGKHRRILFKDKELKQTFN